MASRQSKTLRLKETTDFTSMKQLALDSGMEEGSLEGLVRAYGFFDEEELVACAGLKEYAGFFSLECVAVKDSYRGRGLGRKLVEKLEEEAARRGAKKIWAVARAPAFFEKVGYEKVEAEEKGGPNLAACLTCRQYLRNCHPSLVVKML